MSTIEQVSPLQFHTTPGLEDWRTLGDGASAYFRTGSFAAGARLVQAIAELGGLSERHPDVDVRHAGVTVRLITHEPGYFGLSERDVELARQISGVARELGLASDPTALQCVQIAIDALVFPDVFPFWQAVLDFHDRGDGEGGGDLVDWRFRSSPVWFQQMDAPRPQRNRIHIDITVPYELAEARVAAALAAGGRLVNGDYAPQCWVLADAEGNEACVVAFGTPNAEHEDR
jgi:4a-hydroxytetrahydrobiopterin dehydratase